MVRRVWSSSSALVCGSPVSRITFACYYTVRTLYSFALIKVARHRARSTAANLWGEDRTSGDLEGSRSRSTIRFKVFASTKRTVRVRAREGQMRRPHLASVITIILLAACTYDRGSRAVTGEPKGTLTAPAPAATSPRPP